MGFEHFFIHYCLVSMHMDTQCAVDSLVKAAVSSIRNSGMWPLDTACYYYVVRDLLGRPHILGFMLRRDECRPLLKPQPHVRT